MTSTYILELFTFHLLISSFGIECKELYNIYWNTSNPLFRLGQNTLNVNNGNSPWEFDQANIICPVYPHGSRPADMETFIIYNVSKEEYDSCRIRNPSPRIIALCNSPHNPRYYTITFRSFTPTPGGMEFEPGASYYFISTSSRRDIHRRIDGRCASNNMRLLIRLASLRPDSRVNTPPRGQEEYFYEVPLSGDSKNKVPPDIVLIKGSAKQEASVMSGALALKTPHFLLAMLWTSTVFGSLWLIT